ncbi:MAG TPA: LapA family protein [Candidatus Krumholzibacteria bacterium]|nr:LapA family protein [Candidatus Krumholzibacteria bacterium]
MWWLLKIILFVVLLALLVFVAVSNDAVVAEIHLLGWHPTDVPVFLVMFGSALVGLFFGLAFTAVRELQWRMRVSRVLREQGKLKREVDHLRKSPLQGLDETPAVGDPAGRPDPKS